MVNLYFIHFQRKVQIFIVVIVYYTEQIHCLSNPFFQTGFIALHTSLFRKIQIQGFKTSQSDYIDSIYLK